MNLEHFFRDESGRILATLIRLLGDFDVAEEAMQEAFAAALQQWPQDGMPARPRAWVVATARHKAVDQLRRKISLDAKQAELERLAALEAQPVVDDLDSTLMDDSLRLIFTCCHPALAPEAQVALTLRAVCGLTMEEIAHAFLIPVPTLAKRVVRAKQKIRDAGIPYQVPPRAELPERLSGVMLVVYLVFNEGYAATLGDTRQRRPLCLEAIRLGRLLCELMPQEPEVRALLALMLLHDSRRDARVDARGDIVLLDDQDRGLWDHEQIREGLALVESALRSAPPGRYSLQAAIAALHAQPKRATDTDWLQIAQLYRRLLQTDPSPVVELNYAVAVAMADGPLRGLRLLDEIEATGELATYHLLPATRADLLRRLGRWEEGAVAYRRALALVTNDTERRFLARRLREAEERVHADPEEQEQDGGAR